MLTDIIMTARRRLAAPKAFGAAAIAALLLMAVPAHHAEASCIGDLDGNGVVDGGDLGVLLAAWGTSNPTADINGDGMVDGADLGLLLGAWGGICEEPVIVATELAGTPLAAAPGFRYDLAFNAGGDIHIAIDPLRFPEVVGRNAAIYVVANRTAEEYESFPFLIDVRLSGADAVTFGDTLETCTFLISAGSLPAGTGTDIAALYDVIVDFDLNGLLSPGDFIDGLDGPGFGVVRDMTVNGPYSVTIANYSVTGISSGLNLQRSFRPSNLADLGPRPLVIISHGNGHNYTWYNYLGELLASYGYIVVSHQNNTGPGIESASLTTLQHTQSFIAQQAAIAGGAFNGLIDTSTIIWIGHSRGGEGIVRAHNRIITGSFNPTNYGADDIKLLASIAPTDFLGTVQANPGNVPYHLIYGAADGDVCGCPNNPIAFSFSLYERAQTFRQSLYIHGSSHNDFHCCGTFNDFTGPAGTALGKAETQRVAKASFLPLIKHVIEGDEVARDFLWRSYENLRPVGVSSAVTAVRDHRDMPGGGEFVIDDFQTNPALALSSSGGAVSWDLDAYIEIPMRDLNTSFTWLATDPMNGMTRGRNTDSMRANSLEYGATPGFVEFEVVPGARDVSELTWLAFRAAQITRHPSTISSGNPHNFRVSLRDGSGTTASVEIGAMQTGLVRPYARTGFGTGAGWQNEVQSVWLRLTDFLAGDSGLDLTDIEAVRFEFGGPGLESGGRISLDSIRILPN